MQLRGKSFEAQPASYMYASWCVCSFLQHPLFSPKRKMHFVYLNGRCTEMKKSVGLLPDGLNDLSWIRVKPKARSFLWACPTSLERAHNLEPYSTAFTGPWMKSWIYSGVPGTWIRTHMGCWPCTQQLNMLYHSTICKRGHLEEI